jgi:Fe-S-cluster containining protein
MIDNALIRPISDGGFSFACRNSLSCFTKCCANLDLILTPYDVLRLKTRLDCSSGVFLENYTFSAIDETYGVPSVRLRMKDDELRRCPFVTPDGCSVYEDRPGACRIYPLGRAASKVHVGLKAGSYYFVVKEPHCLGLAENKRWTVDAWIIDQGLQVYNEMNDLFLDVTAGRQANHLKSLGERKLQMFYMACYSLDDFRRFILQTTFLNKFDIPKDEIIRLKTDDAALMRFSCLWLRFALFGEKTLPVIERSS